MRYLSFKILVLCILLPPLLYISSTYLVEKYLTYRHKNEIQAIMIKDTAPLLNGSIAIKDAISRNIDSYLEKHTFLKRAGIRLNVTVTTKDGELVYPVFPDQHGPHALNNPEQIASNNFRILKKGLVLDVDVAIEGNAPASNALLAIFVMMSFLILLYHYRTGIKEAIKDEEKKAKQIKQLARLEQKHKEKLDELKKEKETLLSETKNIRDRLKQIKQESTKNEEELLQEIIQLEQDLEQNQALQEKQETEIEALKQKILQYEQRQTKAGKNRRPSLTARRFKSLYKNLRINARALNGYDNLDDDLKIKAEEIIYMLNQDPSLVPVKRKVFGGKKAEKVLEVMFGYKGRLYYRRIRGNKIEILAIGTKNTQAKELEFLSNL